MLQRYSVLKTIICLLVSGCFQYGYAQDTIMYHGGYDDGAVMAAYSSFSPQATDQQYAFAGGSNDGHALAVHQGYNRSFLTQYAAYTSGMLGDGYAGHLVVNIPLPLGLTAFTGKWTDAGALLQWSMTDEKHIARYELERSRDGKAFTIINTQDVPLQTGLPVTRQYTDEHPFPGKNFYRLKIAGENGADRYSNMVLLFFNEAGTSVAVFPNPAAAHINIRYRAGMEGIARLADMKGTVLKTMVLPAGEHNLPLSLSGLPAGMYLLDIFNPGNAVKTIRFVKE